MKQTLYLRAVLVAVAVSGCSDGPTAPPGGTAVVVGRASYMIGDTVDVEIINHSSVGLRYGHCLLYLQYREGAHWGDTETTIPPSCLLNAAANSELIRGPGNIVFHLPVADAMPTGDYRFVMRVGLENGSDLVTITSERFAIAEWRPSFVR